MGFLENLNEQEVFKRLTESPASASAETNVRHSKIAVRGSDEIFFAHNSTIRCTKISNSKSYKLLDVKGVDFEITGIKINTSGTLLAIYNENNIIVSTLPSTRFMNSPDSLIREKSFKVGKSIFASASIIELEWNSTSRFDSNVVVLSSDGFVRAFDLSSSPDIPETSYDLTSPSHHQVGLVTNSISSPVSITFGSSRTLAGALTLYILNGDGDVFSVYPFLSKTIVVSKDSVEDLLNETVLLTNGIVEKSNMEARKQAIGQLRFVKSLWKQIATAPTEIRGSQELCILQPEISDKFYIQGPFAMRPYPEALYDDTALTITSIPCGPISLLCISYAGNGFSIVLQDPRHVMKFQVTDFEDSFSLGETDDEIDDDFLSLSVLEFKSSTKTAPCRIVNAGQTTLLQRGNEIYELDFSKWASFFGEALADGDIGSALDSNVASTEIRKLKTLVNGEVYEGAFCLENEYGEKFKCITTNHSVDVFANSERANKMQTSDEHNNLETISGAKLGAPYFEIEQLVNQLRNAKIIPPSNASTSLSSDEDSLRGLNDVSSQVTKQLMTLHKLGLALNYRTINQKTELERQLDISSDLTKRLQGVESKTTDCSQKISSSIERQDAIIKRFKALAEKIQEGTDLPLSVSEKSWFKEIQKLAVSFNNSAKQNMVLKEQLRYIKTDIDSKMTSAAKVNVDLGEWDLINKIMKEGRDMVQETSSTLNQNLNELNERLRETNI